MFDKKFRIYNNFVDTLRWFADNEGVDEPDYGTFPEMVAFIYTAPIQT